MYKDIHIVCDLFHVNKDILDNDFSCIISYFEKMILNSNYSNNDKRFYMANVFMWVRLKLIDKITSSDLFKKRESEILKDSSYYIDDHYVGCLYNTPITTIITTDNEIINIRDDVKYRLITSGYGVSKFYIEKNFSVREVWCEGNHPNKNPVTNIFCMDSSIKDLALNLDNLNVIKQIVQTVNLNSSYMDENKLRDFMSLL